MKIFASLAVVALVLAVAVAVMQGTGLLSGVPVMAQSTIAAPGKPEVRKGDRPGEVVVSWEGVVGAHAYRVGWLKEEHMLNAGPNYADFIEDSRVRVSERRHIVRGLVPGDQYWFIVGSLDQIGRVYWSGWSEKIAARAMPVPPSNCTQVPQAPHDGYGAYCPITGLRLVGEHHEIGDGESWGGFRFEVLGDPDNLHTPGFKPSLLETGRYHKYIGDSQLGIGDDYYYLPRISGRRYLRLVVRMVNNEHDVELNPGREYAMDTNAGVAFVVGGAREVYRGFDGNTELLFEIPDRATVAVLAVRPLYRLSDSAWNEPELFRIPVDALIVEPGLVIRGR